MLQLHFTYQYSAAWSSFEKRPEKKSRISSLKMAAVTLVKYNQVYFYKQYRCYKYNRQDSTCKQTYLKELKLPLTNTDDQSLVYLALNHIIRHSCRYCLSNPIIVIVFIF